MFLCEKESVSYRLVAGGPLLSAMASFIELVGDVCLLPSAVLKFSTFLFAVLYSHEFCCQSQVGTFECCRTALQGLPKVTGTLATRTLKVYLP